MRPVSQNLANFLNANTNFLMADLYTIALSSGTTLYINTSDIALPWDGHTFEPAGKAGMPGISRGTLSFETGLTVDSLEVTLLCGDSVNLGSTPMVLAGTQGAFDYATVTLERSFQSTWGDMSNGTVVMFVGVVAGQDMTSTSIKLTAKNPINQLNAQWPRNEYTPKCQHLLYDAGCTLSKANFATNATAAAGATTTTLAAQTSTGKPSGYFETGVLSFTGGVNASSRRGVRTFDGTTFTLAVPLLTAPAAGDPFTVYAGCDRTLSVCTSRFANQQHYRGFPYVPRAESAV